MAMQSPDFWQRDGMLPRLLQPLGWLQAAAGRCRRHWVRPYLSRIPVICIGNLTVGGQGKTPTALAVAQHLRALGANPWFLSRGYGGCEAGPLQVDPARHGADQVGDEPLLLAAFAPTIVACRRPSGAMLAEKAGAGVIIMDDGFQNPSLGKSLSLVVIDGAIGFGNGRLLPAGPLREPVLEGVARAQAAVLVGVDRSNACAGLPVDLPVLQAALIPDRTVAAALAGQRLFAFAGIGRPQKFFDMLAALGGKLVGMQAYPDHYPYRSAVLARLEAAARTLDARLITTQKDAARLPAAFRAKVMTLPIALRFADPSALEALIAPWARR